MNFSYYDLAKRWSFHPDIVRKIVRDGGIHGFRLRGRWMADERTILHVVEGRQWPLHGKQLQAALEQPLTVEEVAKELKRSAYTVRDMLKVGDIAGWKLQLPPHLQSGGGRSVAKRWFVDRSALSGYKNEVAQEDLDRRFGVFGIGNIKTGVAA